MRIPYDHLNFLSNCIGAICLVHIGVFPLRGQTEQEIAAQITAVGGRFMKNEVGRVCDVILLQSDDLSVERIAFKDLKELESVSISGKKITDRTLGRFQTIPPGLERLHIRLAQITDDGLIDLLRRQKSLRNVSLDGTPITDRSLSELGQLKELRHLGLMGTKITDKGLKKLVNLPELKSLFLANTAISDAGLKDIKEIIGLDTLILDGTKVTDVGIQHLAELDHLFVLGVNSTNVTEKGKTQIQKALPNLKFFENKQVLKK
jgi:Leucine-rich repeat (LRR) protein